MDLFRPKKEEKCRVCTLKKIDFFSSSLIIDCSASFSIIFPIIQSDKYLWFCCGKSHANSESSESRNMWRMTKMFLKSLDQEKFWKYSLHIVWLVIYLWMYNTFAYYITKLLCLPHMTFEVYLVIQKTFFGKKNC